MNPLLKVKVKRTGKVIQVYKHQHGKFIDYADCNTEYDKSEIAPIKT